MNITKCLKLLKALKYGKRNVLISFIISKKMHILPSFTKNVILDPVICIFQDMFFTSIINLESLKWYLKLVPVSFCHLSNQSFYKLNFSVLVVKGMWIWQCQGLTWLKKYTCSDFLCMKNINPTTRRPIFTSHWELMLCIVWSQLILT